MKQLLLIIIFCGWAFTSFGQIQANLQASTVEGVAPLTVFFDASQTTHTDKSLNTFHDLNYQWNFGDVYSGIWDFKPSSRNTPSGVLMAHVFDSSGTFIVELEVSDFQGNSAIQTIVIRVLPAQRYYESSTICFSTNNDFEGCPNNAQKVIFEDGDLSVAQAFVGDNRQLLFKNGDTITVNEPLNIKWAKHLTIGAFGECWEQSEKGICKNAPVFRNRNATAVIQISSPDGTQQPSDIILKNLKFVNENHQSTAAIFCQNFTKRNLFYQLEIDGFTNGIFYDYQHLMSNYQRQALFDEITIANCLIKNGLAVGNLVTLSGERVAVLGNTLSDAKKGQSILEMQWIKKGIIAHNQLLYPGKKFYCLNLNSPLLDTAQKLMGTEQVIIADNHFESYQGSEKIVQILPTTQKSKTLYDIILEGNYFNTGTDKSVQYGLVIAGENITIRNNIINGSGANKSLYTGITISNNALSVRTKNIKTYNNTIYRQDWVKLVIGVCVGEAVENVSITNNLIYSPLATKYKLTEDIGGRAFANNNVSPTHNPFINKKPTQPLDFQLDTNNVVVSKNENLYCTYKDFYGQNRKTTSTCDIGAFEFTLYPITKVNFEGLSISSIHNYPNPQRNYLSIDLSKITGTYNVEIFNLQNMLIYSDYDLTNRFYVWQVDAYENGIYWVKVASKNATFLTKVLVQR